MTETEIEQAIALVVEDVRHSYPGAIRDEAMQHAYRVLSEDDLDDSELGRAYAVVLCLFDNPELMHDEGQKA